MIMHTYDECLDAVKKKFKKPVIRSFEYKGNYIFYLWLADSPSSPMVLGNPWFEVNSKTLSIRSFSELDFNNLENGRPAPDIEKAYNDTLRELKN